MKEPKLRFAEFTDEWKVLKLSDIAARIDRKNSNNETDLPLTISSLNGLVDQRTYFNKVVASKDMSGYYLLKNGEFAYNKSYSVGYDYGSIKRLDKFDMGALSTLYICFSLKDTKQSDFIVKYFDSQKWYKGVYAISAEGARNHGLLNIPVNDFFNMEICLPKYKKEEERILELFACIDNVINAIESEVTLWEKKKKGVMQKIFSQEVRFKKEDGSDYPEWKELVFMDIATLSKDKYNPNLNEQYKCIELDNIEQGTGQIKGYVISSKQNSIKNVFHMGDILFGKLRPYLRKYAKPDFDGVCSSEIWVLHPNKDVVCTEFLYYLVASDSFIATANVSFGTKMPRADWKLVSNMCFGIPVFEEQQKIADCLSFIDKTIEIKKQKLETWKNIKKGLLQQMFV